MRVSFVLRLDPERLSRGQLLGEIEEVTTGRTGGLQSLDDVFLFCTAIGDTSLGTVVPGGQG